MSAKTANALSKKPIIPRRIVVAVDGSQHSENAFKWFIDKIHKPKDYVIAVHIPEYKNLSRTPIMTSDATMMTKMIDEEQANTRLLLARINELMKRSHVEGTTKQFAGEPGETIVETAKKEGADFIVTGSRGLGAIRRTFLGSVSDYIVHHSQIPVLICRIDDMI